MSGRGDQAHDYLARMGTLLEKIDPFSVNALVDAIWELWQAGGTLYICGNGGSAATATHMACDLAKQTVLPPRAPLRAISLTDNIALMTAWANDAGFERLFAEQLRMLGRAGDALLCLSCSGDSRNIVVGAEAARELEIKVLALGGFGGGRLRELADVYVHVPSSDYGMVESSHLVLNHCLTAALRERATAVTTEGVLAQTSRSVVIVDRDGVINRNLPGGVRRWEDFEFLPGALDGLARLARQGHRVVVVTNQANVGRGLLTPAQLEDIHRRMMEAVLQAGGAIEAIYVCPHRPEDRCDCRKPAPGLLQRAARERDFSLEYAYVIGDHRTDVEAAVAVGAHPLLVLSGRESWHTIEHVRPPAIIAADLSAAAALVVDPGEGLQRLKAAAL